MHMGLGSIQAPWQNQSQPFVCAQCTGVCIYAFKAETSSYETEFSRGGMLKSPSASALAPSLLCLLVIPYSLAVSHLDPDALYSPTLEKMAL